MKRFLALFFALGMLFSLASCSAEQASTTQGDVSHTDPENLSAVDLYQEAAEKTLKSSYFYLVKMKGEGKEEEISVRRTKKGYSNYSYERKSDSDTLIYTSGVVYASSPLGKFSSESTPERLDAYLKEKYPSFYALPIALFSQVENDGMTVRYAGAKEEIKQSFSRWFPDVQITSIAGKAEIQSDYFIASEEITLIGQKNGEEVQYVVTATLQKAASAEISAPYDADAFRPVADIRLPEKIYAAFESVFGLDSFSLTAVASQKFSFGDFSYALHRELNLYERNGQNQEALSHYHSVQSLAESPRGQDYHLYQLKIGEGMQTETLYELTNAALLKNETAPAEEISLRLLLAEWMLQVKDLEDLQLFEGQNDTTASFKLSSDILLKKAKAIIFDLVGDSYPVGDFENLSCGGTLTWDNQTGKLISIGFYLRGDVMSQMEDDPQGAFAGQYSLTVDNRELAAVPDLQIPTPTYPGQQP